MIQIQKLAISFGGTPILRDLTWTIRTGQRIGLIGPNGAGKTTILRVVAGRLTPDEGSVSAPAGSTVGFLEQDVQEMDAERSVIQEAMTAFAEIVDLESRERQIVDRLEQIDDHESAEYLAVLERQAEIHSELVRLESHLARPRAEAVLTGLGFDPEDFDRPLGTFSGGWRMRVALARLLLRSPGFLLLDEPTNHLDIDSIDWLEAYLKGYLGTVVIVSHDRYFLDRMVNVIAELSRGRVTEYHGNYTFYLSERDKRWELQRAAYENQQKQIADTERFIERFRYKASKARQVQSRIKMLEKLERVEPPPSDEATITLRFPAPVRSGRAVLHLSRFSKAYSTAEGPIRVFKDAGPLGIERGDKIAVIGKNGAGKSTLARMICGTEPFEGTSETGYRVETTFFAQHQAESLNPVLNVLESLQEVAAGQSETDIRNLLGAFLFSGDDVFNPVSVLSGGERSRVALARTLLRPANFLVLDEPTNHLDMQSINVLIEALQQYSGTFVVVSHDRHFLDRIINKVWRLGGGTVREFIGNYSDYMWQVSHGTARDFVDAEDGAVPQRPEDEKSRSGGPKTREQKRLEAEERNKIYRELREAGEVNLEALTPRQLRQALQSVESEILVVEERQHEIEAALARPEVYADADRVRETTETYESIKSELSALYDRWDRLATSLSNVEEARDGS